MSRFQMMSSAPVRHSSPGPAVRPCGRESCGSTLHTPGHPECPIHSPCLVGSSYDPTKCPVCKARLEVVLARRRCAPDGDPRLLRDLHEWALIRTQFVTAADCLLSRDVALQWANEELASFFQPLMAPRHPPGPPVPPTPSTSTSSPVPPLPKVVSAPDPSRAQEAISLLTEYFARAPRRSRSPGPRVGPSVPVSDHLQPGRPRVRRRSISPSTSSKRQRQSRRHRSRGSRSPSPTSDVSSGSRPPSSGARSDVEESAASDLSYGALPSAYGDSGRSLPKGWQALPSSWTIVMSQDGQPSACDKVRYGGEVHLVLKDVELKWWTGEGSDSKYLWRPWRVAPDEVVPRPVSEVSSMAADLTALSQLLSSCDESAPEVSQVTSSSRNPRLRVSGMGAPSYPDSAEIRCLWDRLSGLSRKTSDPDSLKVRPPKCSVQWPAGSVLSEVQDFLSAPKARKEDFYYRLKVPSARVLGEDFSSRTSALQSWSVLSLLDVLGGLASSSATAARDLEGFDSAFALDKISGAMKGLSALLVPVVRTQLEEAVSRRLAVRSAAIPKDLDKIRVDLLASSPLHPLPLGDQGALRSMIKEVPLPMQLTLPARLLQALDVSRAPKRGSRGVSSSSSSRLGTRSRRSEDPPRSSVSSAPLPSTSATGSRQVRPSSQPFRGRAARQSRSQRRSARGQGSSSGQPSQGRDSK